MARPKIPFKKTPKAYSLPEEIINSIRMMADEAGISQSFLVQKILEEFLKRNNKQIDLFGGSL